MKITKLAQKKIKLLAQNHPDIFCLFPSEETFSSCLLLLIEGFALLYGFTKILNLAIKVIIEIDNPDNQFTSREQFLNVLRNKLSSEVYNTFEKQDEEKNYIKTYFDEVGKVYALHNNFKEKIEFLPENRELFIKSNLKLVISTAKLYMNLGVPLEDLIGAGNVGLCEAFDKFKAARNSIQSQIIEEVEASAVSTWSKEEAKAILEKYYTYGNALEKLEKKIPKTGFQTKEAFVEWTSKNIKPAVFASVAYMWIRAEILIEINKNSYIVKLPKDATEKMPAKTHFISIAEYNSQDDNPDFDIPSDDYETTNDLIDLGFKQTYYKNTVNRLLAGLSARERRILIKKFGIGIPYAMRINEIAEDEDISPSRCTIAFKEAIAKIMSNLSEEQKDEIVHYLHFD